MPLLSAHSNSTCFEADRVNGKDGETGDSRERLNSGPLLDQTVVPYVTDLPSKERDLQRWRHFHLAVSEIDTMQQEGRPRFLKFHQGSVRGVAFSPRVGIRILGINVILLTLLQQKHFRTNRQSFHKFV